MCIKMLYIIMYTDISINYTWYIGMKGDTGEPGLPGVKGDPGIHTEFPWLIILHLILNQFV